MAQLPSCSERLPCRSYGLIHMPEGASSWPGCRAWDTSETSATAAGVTYGEMLLQNEYEMSCYNLDAADVASQQQLFQLHQQARMPSSWHTISSLAPPLVLGS